MGRKSQAEILLVQASVSQRRHQCRELGAHALGLEVELGQFCRLDPTPQRDRIIDPM
jgi:hypothetical protein